MQDTIFLGIVGSRKRNSLRDRQIVSDIISSSIRKFSSREIIIVSGGCRKGADFFAEEIARLLKLQTLIHRVPLNPPIENKQDFRKRAFDRNELIAASSDILFALVHSSRKGGTENTINHGVRLGKHVFIVNEAGLVHRSNL